VRQILMSLGAGSGVGAVIAAMLLAPLSLLMVAAITHLFALIFGAGGRGFNATFRVVCYDVAPAVFAISCLAFPALIYQWVIRTIGLKEVHGTTTGKAAAAVLAPLVLCCCCIFGLAMAAGAAAAAAAGK
jgi:hypothetical protein